jgi:hypothetical protein
LAGSRENRPAEAVLKSRRNAESCDGFRQIRQPSLRSADGDIETARDPICSGESSAEPMNQGDF